MSFAILMPSRNRPHLMRPLVENIRATTPGVRPSSPVERPVGVYFAVTDPESYRTLIELGVKVWMTDPEWSCCERTQFLYERTVEDYLYLAQDDSLFTAGWQEPALSVCREIDGVVAVADGNRRTGTTGIVSRRYVETLSCAPDEPNVVGHRGYHHNFVETECFEVAESRGRFAYCPESLVEHRHHKRGLAAYDETYRRNEQGWEHDKALFHARRHLWGR